MYSTALRISRVIAWNSSLSTVESHACWAGFITGRKWAVIDSTDNEAPQLRRGEFQILTTTILRKQIHLPQL